MPSILSRDLDLDLSLESEARTTLIIAGVAVGVLVLFAVVIFFKQYIRRYEGLTRTNSNTTDSTTTDLSKAPPTFIPLKTMLVSQPTSAPHARTQRPPNDTRRQGFFSPMRKYPSTPRYSNISVYRGANGLHTPPPLKLVSSSRPPTMPSLSMQTFAHNAAWMELADSVVGRHPNAKPLNNRVATKAEIDMISGHVHIPWAYNISDRPQPIPVKVLKPVVLLPAVPNTRQGLLNDVGNIGNRDLRVSNGSRTIINLDAKVRHVRRNRGKENMPATLPVPGSSVRVRN